jgi:hypothetical protein
MRLWDMHPANLRDGDRLCGDDGAPFATVNGAPWVDGQSVWVDTDVTPVEFPAGTTANVDR